jgi:putative MFS transporter
MLFRYLQGVGTGGEVPVASAYISEFIGAEKRGRFFLL